ncbi:MAG: hypothetical protein AAFY64_06415 [Pseudomonadota bacterium]
MSENVLMPWLSAYPDGIAWDHEFTPRPLTEIMDNAVATYGAKT